ncbi:MAG: radical SAM protein [Ruminococcaceae bacterium]|nr:radical SAM protein [Oscillospiraceae bacterium]
MYYILNPQIALRSFWRVPHSYYIRGVRDAKKLSKEEYDLLSGCDGSTDLEDSDLLDSLVQRGFISPCEKGEKLLDPWQIRVCDNRYFPAMNLMITGKCNYNCLHCFNASDNAPLMSEFSLEEAERLLDEAELCGINAFTITGGEPMAHKHFFDIIEGIYKRNMFVEELNTNGFYLDQAALDRMRRIGCYPLIKISFDGVGHHDWLRNRKGAEADALRAIRLCIDNGFRVKAQTNVHRKNIGAMLPTALLLDEMGVDEMRIIRTTEVPRWNENSGGATLGLEEYFDGMLEFAGKYSRGEHNMKIDIWQFLTLFPKTKSYRMRPVECGCGEYRDSIPVCRGNRGMIAVAANGNVFPCMQMSGYYEANGDILGNVKKSGLAPLLQCGKYLSEVCTTVGELARANPTCGSCPYFKHCVGGCRAVALTLTGDKMGVDLSKCLFFKKGYVKKLETCLYDWKNISPIQI